MHFNNSHFLLQWKHCNSIRHTLLLGIEKIKITTETKEDISQTSSTVEDPLKYCCKEKGVPRTCMGFCRAHKEEVQEISMSKGRSIVGRCGKYLTDIKSCIAGNDRISFSLK